MSRKADIRTCRYANCTHESINIDITKDNYRIISRLYYHSDCADLKEAEIQKAEQAKKDETAKKAAQAQKDEQTRNDLQYIKNGWVLHISNTVVFSQLFRCLNELIARGISSEYLVFVFDYVVKNKMNLRHPFGFKYYVDMKEIKDAYRKHQIAKNGIVKQSDFVAVDDESSAPKFTVPQKPQGFKSILGGKK